MPHGQGPNEVTGPEGRLLGRQVRPAQPGQDALPAQEVQAAGGVEVHHRHPSARAAQRPCQVQQQDAGPQSPAGTGDGQDLGGTTSATSPDGGGRPQRLRRRAVRTPHPRAWSPLPRLRRSTGLHRITGGGPQGREGHVSAVPHRPAPCCRSAPGCPPRPGSIRRPRRRVLLPQLRSRRVPGRRHCRDGQRLLRPRRWPRQLRLPRLPCAVLRGNGRLPHRHLHRHRPLLSAPSLSPRSCPQPAVATTVATAALPAPRPVARTSGIGTPRAALHQGAGPTAAAPSGVVGPVETGRKSTPVAPRPPHPTAPHRGPGPPSAAAPAMTQATAGLTRLTPELPS